MVAATLMQPAFVASQNSLDTSELDTALTGGYIWIVDAQVENLHCGDVEYARQLEGVLMRLARTVLTNPDLYQRKIEAIQSIRAARKPFWNMGDSRKCDQQKMESANIQALEQLRKVSSLAKLHLSKIG